MPERIDSVDVATPRGTVSLEWIVRDQLIRKLQGHRPLDPVVRDFENAGATQPVEIPEELHSRVVHLIDTWAASLPEGQAGLPPGIRELRKALYA